MRSPYSPARARKVSATLSGAWLGSMIPPDPTRIVLVAAATAAIMTSGAELVTLAMLWCSASQKRRYPAASAVRASSTVSRRARLADDPEGIGGEVEHGERDASSVTRVMSHTKDNAAGTPRSSRLAGRPRLAPCLLAGQAHYSG